MAKKKKIKTPYREDNFHHLLFGDSECSNPEIEECSIDEINSAIADWQIIVDIELRELDRGFNESSAYFLKRARQEIQILKLQKREILARAV